MAFKKYQIKYFIIILLATSAINMPTVFSVTGLMAGTILKTIMKKNGLT